MRKAKPRIYFEHGVWKVRLILNGKIVDDVKMDRELFGKALDFIWKLNNRNKANEES